MGEVQGRVPVNPHFINLEAKMILRGTSVPDVARLSCLLRKFLSC